MKRTFILIFIPLGIPYDAFEIVKPLLFVNWLLFMFSISYIYSISLTLDLMYVNRRKHSELVGELSNSYNKEEKLLSEVCMCPGFQVS